MKKFLLIILALLCVNSYAQEKSLLPEGLSLSNQMKYSWDIKEKREIFENWLNLDYRYNIFSAGIRMESFQPNDPNTAVSRGKEKYADIPFKFVRAEIGDFDEGLDVTVGNFYALFGRGMILKSYEDRNVRVDNNLLGVKVIGRYSNFILTALSGMAENSAAIREDIIHAADLEYTGLDFLKTGLSFATNEPKNSISSRTRLTSLRIQPSFWNFDIYSEFGIKQNESENNRLPEKEVISGKAFYSSLNFYIDKIAFTGEYKLYDNYMFTSDDGTVIYNNPPSVRKEYGYILLNRHPSPLNQNNEEGYQFELNYSLSDYTSFAVNYGSTKTLSPSSYYQTLLGTKTESFNQLKEFYVQGSHQFGDKLLTIGGFNYMEEASSDTKALTGVLENRFYFDNINTIKLVVEHQQAKVNSTLEEYYDDVITLEYLRSPKLSISLVTEMKTTEPEKDKIIRKFWNFVQVGYKFGEHTDVSVLFGTRQAGNICIGGVCRYEPAFNGIEFKMLTRL